MNTALIPISIPSKTGVRRKRKKKMKGADTVGNELETRRRGSPKLAYVLSDAVHF